MSVFNCRAGTESPRINGNPAASPAAKPPKRVAARIIWLVRMETLEEGTMVFAERQAQPTSSSSQGSSRDLRDQAEPRWAVQLPDQLPPSSMRRNVQPFGAPRFRACNGAKEL